MSEENILNSEAPDGSIMEQTAQAEAPQAAPVESEAASNVNESSWYSEDYADLIESKGFQSADDVLKSYKNLEALTGNSVRIPSADASDEAKADFYEKIKDLDGVLIRDSEDFYDRLGRPEEASQYKFDEVIEPELYNAVPGLHEELDDFQHLAHEVGLTNEQAAKLVQMRMDTLENQQEAIAAHRTAAEQALKEKWGSDYDNRLNSARQVIKIFSEKHGDAVNELVNSAAGNNPALLDMLSELGASYKEGNHIGMQDAQFGLTPEMAQAKIAEKRADRGFLEAYQDEMHPGHKQAINELQKLYQIANGG